MGNAEKRCSGVSHAVRKVGDVPSSIRLLPLMILALLAAGCARNHPPVTSIAPQTAAAEMPRVEIDPRNGEHRVTLSVLSYNVAGLPWPRRKGTGHAMERIAEAWTSTLSRAPDVLLLQEAFVPSATWLPDRFGYANVVRGPTRRARAEMLSERPSREFRKGRRVFKGERLVGRVVGSGLMLGSNIPIGEVVSHPFGRARCAGFDCMANKGVMLVELKMPGLPEPLFILNTHLNSRGASGVRPERSLQAYRLQLQEIAALLDQEWRGRGPLIWVGDFNARGSEERFDAKDALMPGEIAHRYCQSLPGQCLVQASWDSDEPWRDTQDLQGFADGAIVKVRPVAIAARFDEPFRGGMLSDHDGLEVTWQLSWPGQSAVIAGRAPEFDNPPPQ